MTAAIELLCGLVGLVLAGTAIVRGASVIGAKLGLPPLLIGLTIVAAGTSAPELAVVWQAAANGEPGIALGSVVGSNVANVALVLGLVAMISSISVSRQAVRLDGPVMIAASLLVLLLGLDGSISRSDGLILVAGLAAYIVTTVSVSRRSERHKGETAEHETGTSEPSDTPRTRKTGTLGALTGRFALVADTFAGAVAVFAAGAAGVAVSANYVVSGAGALATSWGMSELVVGLTVVAVGTSAPEIATSVIAALRGDGDVALGNVIGSNIFNLLFVLGLVSSGKSDLPVDSALVGLNLPVMIAVALLALLFARTGHRIERAEGAVFLLIFVVYTVFLILDGTGSGAAGWFGKGALGVIVPLVFAVVAVGVARRRRLQANPF